MKDEKHYFKALRMIGFPVEVKYREPDSNEVKVIGYIKRVSTASFSLLIDLGNITLRFRDVVSIEAAEVDMDDRSGMF